MYFGAQSSVCHRVSIILDSKLCQVAYAHCERGVAHYTLEISHILSTLWGTRERELGSKDE